MSFWDILGTLLIKPLQLLFEVVFVMANRVVGDPGLAIIALSLAMNFLVLPLYRRADAMQRKSARRSCACTRAWRTSKRPSAATSA